MQPQQTRDRPKGVNIHLIHCCVCLAAGLCQRLGAAAPDMSRLRVGLWGLSLMTLAACMPVPSASIPPVTLTPTPEASRLGFADPLHASFAAGDALDNDAVDMYGMTAPPFPEDLDWFNSEPLVMEQLRGKIVLLDFWTFGCVNCQHNFPYLEQMQAAYPEELVVIGVHAGKFAHERNTENIRNAIREYGLTYPVVNDHYWELYDLWDIQGWPTLILIDPNGFAADRYLGEGFYGPFNSLIRQLLATFDDRGKLDRTPLIPQAGRREASLPTPFSYPSAILLDPDQDRLFVADTGHHRIVVQRLSDAVVTRIYGSGQAALQDGTALRATFNRPVGMALDATGQHLYVADSGNHAIRRIDLDTQTVSTLVGTGRQARYGHPYGGQAPDVDLSTPLDLALAGTSLFIAMSGTHQIWHMDLASGQVLPLIGSQAEGIVDGTWAQARLAQPSGLALTAAGQLYFVDSESSTVRMTDVSQLSAAGQVVTLAGGTGSLRDYGSTDGIGLVARFQHPLGLALADDRLYVADTYNHRIRLLDLATRETSTLLGSEAGWQDGTQSLLYSPRDVAVGDDQLYVADSNNHIIRVHDLVTGETRTLVPKLLFAPSPPGAQPDAATVLSARHVQAGPGKIEIDIAFPAGYKVNPEAPFSMTWQQQGDVVTLPPDADRTEVNPQFPLQLDVVFRPGQGSLQADLAVFYCEAVRERLCLIAEMQLEVPLIVGDEGEQVVRLQSAITLPG